jgi:uncharacterized coiled-coil DUF342 family protein
MLQSNEIQQRFTNVEHAVHQANQACQGGTNIPRDLQDCVQQLDRQTSQATQVIQSQDQTRIIQCVDDLEQLSDRAKEVVERSRNVDGGVRDAIMQAHRELSSLKHQLH